MRAKSPASNGLLRAAIALNLFTHGLLTMLLWVVIWAMKN
jgi:hypothetical protein